MNDKIQRCSEQVSSDAWHFHQCSRKVVVERDGKFYCKIHDPEYVKNKRDRKQKEYDDKWARRNKRFHRVQVMEEYFAIVSTEKIEQMIKDRKRGKNG